MTNKSNVLCTKKPLYAQKVIISKGLKLNPLAQSRRDIIALGGLVLTSSGVWAEAQINPNEIWLGEPMVLDGICAKDIDQDGDLDIFNIFSEVVYMLENTGTAKAPEFSSLVPLVSNPGNVKLSRLGIVGNCISYVGETLVDIDADGDLDLFSNLYDQDLGTELFYFFRNDGTTENPVYATINAQEEFGFPDSISNYIFKDIDKDGDQDFWSNFDHEPVFFENTGTPESAAFIQRNTSPIQPLCFDGTELGFIIDLNNDGQWDMLCKNYDGSYEYFESSNSGFLPKRSLFVNANTNVSSIEAHAFDIDSDGDTDIIKGGYDIIDHNIEYYSLAYAANTGTNLNPVYNLSSISTEFVQCSSSFAEIAIANKADLRVIDRLAIVDTALVDIDGDNDLDLFSYLTLDELDLFSNDKNGPPIIASTSISIYCENVGSTTNPLFAPGSINAFGLNAHAPDYGLNIFFSDMDGDGDQDAWIESVFYDNVGNSTEPLFRHYDNLLFFPKSFYTNLLDLDGDSRVDSILDGDNRLLNKGLEPATDIKVTALSNGNFVIATNRPSQLQLQVCLVDYTDLYCQQSIALPGTARNLSLSAGDFTGNGRKDIVLAMIDAEGHLKIEIFDQDLKLIGNGAGGTADSVSVSAGQLDDDSADEYVVSLVQSDGRVAAISFNLDGSRVGKVVANVGKQPSVDVGNFGGTGDAYVLAYLTPDDSLETAVFKGDGTLIGQGSGGQASHIRVTAAELFSSNPGDEYAISLIQSDGTVALISYAAYGTRLGKVAGGISHQPKVISSKTSGLAVSVILSDKKPAIIFLDNQGKHLGTGVGGVAATVSTIELIDTDSDGIDDRGVLVYLDEAGNPRIGVYDLEGKKVSQEY